MIFGKIPLTMNWRGLSRLFVICWFRFSKTFSGSVLKPAISANIVFGSTASNEAVNLCPRGQTRLRGTRTIVPLIVENDRRC